jgi:hypothetical protein
MTPVAPPRAPLPSHWERGWGEGRWGWGEGHLPAMRYLPLSDPRKDGVWGHECRARQPRAPCSPRTGTGYPLGGAGDEGA